MPRERRTVEDQRREFAQAALQCSNFRALCWEFGLPNYVLSDNDAQVAGFKKGYTQFERWLMDLDVLPIHGCVKHPQTQVKSSGSTEQ